MLIYWNMIAMRVGETHTHQYSNLFIEFENEFFFFIFLLLLFFARVIVFLLLLLLPYQYNVFFAV